MAAIVVFGSANIDLVVASARLPRPGETLLGDGFEALPGGKGANQAVAAARAGGSVAFVGCVGGDGHGALLRAALAAEDIDLAALTTVDGSSGVALIVTAAGGANMIVVAPGANAALGRDRIGVGAFRDARVVLAQLETPIDGIAAAAEHARAAGAVFVLDPAPAAPIPPSLMPLVDWITPNESEALALLGCAADPPGDAEIARRLRGLGARGVVLKLGARGAMLLEGDGEPVHFAARAVDAVDTTGAGDAFNGAFAVALVEGMATADAVAFAIAASALSVTRRGAQAAMPRRDEIERVRREPVEG